MNQSHDKDTLAEALKMFYIDSKSSLNGVRFGLNRHFLSTRDINIIHDPANHEGNKVFGTKCAGLKRQGLAKVYPLQKLYDCGILI